MLNMLPPIMVYLYQTRTFTKMFIAALCIKIQAVSNRDVINRKNCYVSNNGMRQKNLTNYKETSRST